MINMRGHLAWLYLVLVLAVTGCKTAVTHVCWYTGPVRSTNEVAFVKPERSAFRGFVFVRKINGEPLLKEPEKVRDRVREIALLPGKYELMVGWLVPGPNGVAHSLTDIPVSFTADAGKVYQVRASSLEKSFGESLRLATAGGLYGWTAWVVEAGTGKVVGGVPRETPLKWHER